jgi:hypothetical protein
VLLNNANSIPPYMIEYSGNVANCNSANLEILKTVKFAEF